MNNFDSDFPYDVWLNGEHFGSFVNLEGEDIDGLGSGERVWNDIEVYFEGKLIRSLSTNHGKIVSDWRRP